ncbi:MAG: hypothetical protein HQK55_03105 [Deltaproteobacteria bacterium]|nr:hypothetical protein [Deltaproteobacteria bacterium]
MNRTKDFYQRFIVSCYSRRATRILNISVIRDDALLVMSAEELETFVIPAFDEMLANGRLEKGKEKNQFKLVK